MSNSSDKEKVISGLTWKLAERMFSQGMTFVLSIILARLLMPSQYGIVAMINMFIVIANVFVTAGFSSSLIQKKDADDLDFSTIFYCTLTMAILMYGILFVCAPFIADFYKMPELCLLTRVFSLSLLISSYQTIQNAYISRHMIFKKNFYATSVGTFLSGVIGVTMAYKGFGVWSLVVQQLSSIIINTLTLFSIVKWKPKLIFSWERAKSLMDYGSKILASTLVNTIYREIRQLIIGSVYTPADLALYNRGSHYPNLVTGNIDTTLRSVLFPAMSNHSDNLPRVKDMLRKAIKNSSYVTYFCLTLLAVSSAPLIHLMLTDKWMGCVPYMQIFCICFMIQTVSSSNLQALKAIGKSDEVLKLELFKKPAFLILVLAAVPFGVKAIVCTAPINALYALFLNMGPTKKHLNYSRKEQVKDLLPGLLLAGVMALLTFPLVYLPLNDIAIMCLQIIFAFVIYIVLSKRFEIDAYYYCKNTILEYYSKKRNRNK